MRMEVVTKSNMISLGMFAKDHFIENVLVVDEDGKSFDALQVVQLDTLDRVKNIETKGAFSQRIKDGAIEAFSKMEVGDKFLCLNAWITDYKSDEAKFYWEVQRLCNESHSLKEATELGNNWLKEYRESKK